MEKVFPGYNYARRRYSSFSCRDCQDEITSLDTILALRLPSSSKEAGNY